MGNDLVVLDGQRASVPATTVDPKVIWESMDEEVRKVADVSTEALSQGGLFAIVTAYELGKSICNVRAMAHLGETLRDKQIQLITQYWTALGYPCRVGDAYALCSVASSFTLEYIQSQYEEPLANGQRLSWKHFVVLVKVEESQRSQWLKHVRAQSLSSNQLDMELQARGLVQNVRYGGRKPTVPKAAPVVLNLTRAKLANARKFLEAAGDSFTETCYDYPPDDIDARYVELATCALDELNQLEARLALIRPSLEKVKARAETIVTQQHAAVEDAEVVRVVKKPKRKKTPKQRKRQTAK